MKIILVKGQVTKENAKEVADFILSKVNTTELADVKVQLCFASMGKQAGRTAVKALNEIIFPIDLDSGKRDYKNIETYLTAHRVSCPVDKDKLTANGYEVIGEYDTGYNKVYKRRENRWDKFHDTTHNKEQVLDNLYHARGMYIRQNNSFEFKNRREAEDFFKSFLTVIRCP